MMNSETKKSAEILIDLAFREDLGDGQDVTSELLIEPGEKGSASITARESGVACGLELLPLILKRFSSDIQIVERLPEGSTVNPGVTTAVLKGSIVELLKSERTILNFMGRLTGIASLTRRYVDATNDTKARIYDTRKTTPGWRLLEKYAVQTGGGCNHRMGLYDAILIKDNHLAALGYRADGNPDWIEKLKTAVATMRNKNPGMTLQIEVDTLNQLEQILPLQPDIILLDNMTLKEMEQAVRLRAEAKVELEASGGVNESTVASIAQTGVDRISVGALTHSATNFDWGLDWNSSV